MVGNLKKSGQILFMIFLAALARHGWAQASPPDLSNYHSDFGAPDIRLTEAFISQTGNKNIADIDQESSLGGNYAQVDQAGDTNVATISQAGGTNRLRIEQNGSSNTATVDQLGSGNSLDLSQTGIGNSFRMTQTGDSTIVASQIGNYNVVDAPLLGQGVNGTLREIGDNNSIVVSPNYSGPNLQSVTVEGGMHVTIN